MINLASAYYDLAVRLLTIHNFRFRSVAQPFASISFYGPTRELDLHSAEAMLVEAFGEDCLTQLVKGGYA